MTVFTIGSSGKGLRKFIKLIKGAGIDCIIDVRLNNTSQLLGYAKGDDLEFVLELVEIGYEHIKELAPNEPLLAAYRKNKDWGVYIDRFFDLMDERDMLSIGRGVFDRYGSPCLLCSEESPDKCHRRLIAELWADNIPNLKVIHLR